jgi:putative hemolysin
VARIPSDPPQQQHAERYESSGKCSISIHSISRLAEPPLFVPETMTLMNLLEQFKRTHLPVALVVDEFGELEGLVSLNDVIASIVGELPDAPGEEPMIVRRDDGSWLFDGALDIEAVRRTLETRELFTDDEPHLHTLGGGD